MTSTVRTETQGYYISEADAKILSQVIHEYRRTARGIPSYGVPGDLDGYPPDDIFAPECYVAEIPPEGIPPREGIIPGKAQCQIWKMYLTADEDDEHLVDAEFEVKVHNLSTGWIDGDVISEETGTGSELDGKRFQLVWRDKFGRWYAEKGTEGIQLIELCSLETATRSEPYQCLKGTWNPDLNRWCYDNAKEVWAIDHRMGPPLAEPNWKGLYIKRTSNNPSGGEETGTGSAEVKIIYECVSLDCEEPPEGCNECAES